MEVEHHLKACLFCLATEASDVFQILTYSLALMLFWSVLRIDEQTYSDHVPALLLKPRQQ
jgi:hypothetical protein